MAAGVTRGGRGSDLATGVAGAHARLARGLGGLFDQAIDEDHIYFCTDTNTWKRSPLQTW